MSRPRCASHRRPSSNSLPFPAAAAAADALASFPQRCVVLGHLCGAAGSLALPALPLVDPSRLRSVHRPPRPSPPPPNRTACIGKHRTVSLDPLLGAPFGSTYEAGAYTRPLFSST